MSKTRGVFILCGFMFFVSQLLPLLVHGVNVSSCGAVNSDTLVVANITGNDTCFTINASNIVFDGNGFTITGNNSLVAPGISNNGFANVTIANVTITNFSQGILIVNTTNNTIFNNTINTTLSASLNGDGVPLLLSNLTNGHVFGNNLTSTGSNAQGFIAVFSARNNIIRNNFFSAFGSSAVAGLFVFSAGDNNVTNNTFFSLQGGGISAQSLSHRLLIISNNFTTGAQAINFESSSNQTVSSNSINTTGASGWGIRLSNSSNSVYESNVILTNANVSEALSIDAGSSFNLFRLNTLITGNFDSHGVEMSAGSNYNRFIANNISMSGESTKGFLVGGCTNTLIENNSITHNMTISDEWAVVLNNGANDSNVTNNIFSMNGSQDLQLQSLRNALLTDQFVKNYNIKNAQFSLKNTSSGELRFATNVSPMSGFNLSEQIQIRTNLISVDSVSQPAFNVSANLSFFGINAIGLVNRTPLRNGLLCGAICTVLQDSDTYIFNVTGFTNYSVGGQEIVVFTFDKTDSPDPVSPGAQLHYTISIVITNGTMYNATITETYPAGVAFDSSSPAAIGNTTFDLGNLTVGTHTINITVNVTAPDGTVLQNTATLAFQNSSGTTFAFNETETTTVSTPQSFGGGGGGGSSSSIITRCTPDWSCGFWTACEDGMQERTCTDVNSCGTTTGRPSTSQSCTTSQAPQQERASQTETTTDASSGTYEPLASPEPQTVERPRKPVNVLPIIFWTFFGLAGLSLAGFGVYYFLKK